MTILRQGYGRQTEASLQAASAKYFALKLPKTFIAIHVPNEGRRSWAQGKRLKAQGMTAGVLDWIIMGRYPKVVSFASGRTYMIELKAPGRYMSKEQKKFCNRLDDCGIPWALCRSLDEIEAQLKQWGLL